MVGMLRKLFSVPVRCLALPAPRAVIERRNVQVNQGVKEGAAASRTYFPVLLSVSAMAVIVET